MPRQLLHDSQRKYLTLDERTRFLAAAERDEPEVRTFCGVLAYSGCRISEALELTADRVDLAGGTFVFETLKKRERGIYRSVPVPPALLDTLDLVHGVRRLQAGRKRGADTYLWSWSRTTARSYAKRAVKAKLLDCPLRFQFDSSYSERLDLAELIRTVDRGRTDPRRNN